MKLIAQISFYNTNNQLPQITVSQSVKDKATFLHCLIARSVSLITHFIFQAIDSIELTVGIAHRVIYLSHQKINHFNSPASQLGFYFYRIFIVPGNTGKGPRTCSFYRYNEYQSSILYHCHYMERLFKTKTEAVGEMKNAMREILNKLKAHRLSGPFIDPVDWLSLSLLDYPDKVQEPMDFKTIEVKLNDHQYRYVQDFFRDIELIWSNCLTYNGQGHWLNKSANKLKQEVRRYLKNYFPYVKVRQIKITPNCKQQEDDIRVKEEENNIYAKSETVSSNKLHNYSLEFLKDEKNNCRGDVFEHNATQVTQKLELRENFLLKMKKQSEDRTGMLFLMLKRRCPSQAAYDDQGNMVVNLEKVDDESIWLGLTQMERWNEGL